MVKEKYTVQKIFLKVQKKYRSLLKNLKYCAKKLNIVRKNMKYFAEKYNAEKNAKYFAEK